MHIIRTLIRVAIKSTSLAMIWIQLKLFVTLAPYLPKDGDKFPVEEGTRVQDLVDALGIDASMVKLIFVNGRRQEPSYRLEDGDRLGLFPPVGGG